ncbi:MAG: hypothetical protein KAJ19_08400 [Gammaproteobacteria bacterium]|nr:hypothetical protein [Gammaproteobacteria bacterium]
MLPLNDTAAIQTKTGNTEQGRPTYGAAVNSRCRFELDRSYHRNSEGNQVLTDANIIVETGTVVGEGDFITVDTYFGTVLAFSDLKDVDGVSHHIELYLKSK